MKKKILFLTFVGSLIAGTIIHSQINTDNEANDLLLSNIEALAQGESGSSGRCTYGGVACTLFLNGQIVFSSDSHYHG